MPASQPHVGVNKQWNARAYTHAHTPLSSTSAWARQKSNASLQTSPLGPRSKGFRTSSSGPSKGTGRANGSDIESCMVASLVSSTEALSDVNAIHEASQLSMLQSKLDSADPELLRLQLERQAAAIASLKAKMEAATECLETLSKVAVPVAVQKRAARNMKTRSSLASRSNSCRDGEGGYARARFPPSAFPNATVTPLAQQGSTLPLALDMPADVWCSPPVAGQTEGREHARVGAGVDRSAGKGTGTGLGTATGTTAGSAGLQTRRQDDQQSRLQSHWEPQQQLHTQTRDRGTHAHVAHLGPTPTPSGSLPADSGIAGAGRGSASRWEGAVPGASPRDRSWDKGEAWGGGAAWNDQGAPQQGHITMRSALMSTQAGTSQPREQASVHTAQVEPHQDSCSIGAPVMPTKSMQQSRTVTTLRHAVAGAGSDAPSGIEFLSAGAGSSSTSTRQCGPQPAEHQPMSLSNGYSASSLASARQYRMHEIAHSRSRPQSAGAIGTRADGVQASRKHTGGNGGIGASHGDRHSTKQTGRKKGGQLGGLRAAYASEKRQFESLSLFAETRLLEISTAFETKALGYPNRVVAKACFEVLLHTLAVYGRFRPLLMQTIQHLLACVFADVASPGPVFDASEFDGSSSGLADAEASLSRNVLSTCNSSLTYHELHQSESESRAQLTETIQTMVSDQNSLWIDPRKRKQVLKLMRKNTFRFIVAVLFKAWKLVVSARNARAHIFRNRSPLRYFFVWRTNLRLKRLLDANTAAIHRRMEEEKVVESRSPKAEQKEVKETCDAETQTEEVEQDAPTKPKSEPEPVPHEEEVVKEEVEVPVPVKERHRKSLAHAMPVKALPLHVGMELVTYVYEEKLQQDMRDKKKGIAAQSLKEFIKDVLIRKYGIRSMAMKYYKGLLAAIRERGHGNLRLQLFGRLCGYVRPEEADRLTTQGNRPQPGQSASGSEDPAPEHAAGESANSVHSQEAERASSAALVGSTSGQADENTAQLKHQAAVGVLQEEKDRAWAPRRLAVFSLLLQHLFGSTKRGTLTATLQSPTASVNLLTMKRAVLNLFSAEGVRNPEAVSNLIAAIDNLPTIVVNTGKSRSVEVHVDECFELVMRHWEENMSTILQARATASGRLRALTLVQTSFKGIIRRLRRRRQAMEAHTHACFKRWLQENRPDGFDGMVTYREFQYLVYDAFSQEVDDRVAVRLYRAFDDKMNAARSRTETTESVGTGMTSSTGVSVIAEEIGELDTDTQHARVGDKGGDVEAAMLAERPETEQHPDEKCLNSESPTVAALRLLAPAERAGRVLSLVFWENRKDLEEHLPEKAAPSRSSSSGN